jgi:hypothetical protein
MNGKWKRERENVQERKISIKTFSQLTTANSWKNKKKARYGKSREFTPASLHSGTRGLVWHHDIRFITS